MLVKFYIAYVNVNLGYNKIPIAFKIIKNYVCYIMYVKLLT